MRRRRRRPTHADGGERGGNLIYPRLELAARRRWWACGCGRRRQGTLAAKSQLSSRDLHHPVSARTIGGVEKERVVCAFPRAVPPTSDTVCRRRLAAAVVSKGAKSRCGLRC